MKTKLDCILLIDDDEPTNFLNKMTVEQTGCARHVAIAQSGQEGLDFLMGQRSAVNDTDCPHPDLIFLDINMPAMDGWEFMEKYKQLPKEQKASIVLIMLTTSLNPDDEEKTKHIPEISGFENKPLKERQLEQILEKYFGDRF
ncbi:MAG TPA: response regulator [Puia sp.]|nr:response regulator [Puia sp.]